MVLKKFVLDPVLFGLLLTMTEEVANSPKGIDLFLQPHLIFRQGIDVFCNDPYSHSFLC